MDGSRIDHYIERQVAVHTEVDAAFHALLVLSGGDYAQFKTGNFSL